MLACPVAEGATRTRLVRVRASCGPWDGLPRHGTPLDTPLAARVGAVLPRRPPSILYTVRRARLRERMARPAPRTMLVLSLAALHAASGRGGLASKCQFMKS